ncbi:hypothetical protein ONZ45_g15200 [Pleurotus djamor]|nr:hypothetical protein ONZ45_g15200 [Pleurotus djamor]
MDVTQEATVADLALQDKVLAPHNVVKGVPMNRFLTFLDLLSLATQAELLKDFTLVDLARFSQTCRFIYNMIDAYSQRQRDITRTLSAFFPVEHVPEFRVLQADTGLLIGGTTALKFINWKYKEPKQPTLRIFVHNLYAVRVTEWFIGIGSQHHQPAYPGQTTQEIYDFQFAKVDTLPLPPLLDEGDSTTFCGTVVCDSGPARQDAAASIAAGDARANVFTATFELRLPNRHKVFIYACHESALSGVLSMSTSTMMNFISAHHVYCLFPYETLNRNVVAWLHDIFGYYMNKHREAWRVFPEGLRCVSGMDGHCLQIPLDTKGLALDYRHEAVLDDWYKFQDSNGAIDYYRMVRDTD